MIDSFCLRLWEYWPGIPKVMQCWIGSEWRRLCWWLPRDYHGWTTFRSHEANPRSTYWTNTRLNLLHGIHINNTLDDYAILPSIKIGDELSEPWNYVSILGMSLHVLILLFSYSMCLIHTHAKHLSK